MPVQIQGQCPLLQSSELLCFFSTTRADLQKALQVCKTKCTHRHSKHQESTCKISSDVRHFMSRSPDKIDVPCYLSRLKASMPSILAAIFSSKINWTNKETTCCAAQSVRQPFMHLQLHLAASMLF